MGHPAGVEQLDEDAPVRRVDGLGHNLPAGLLVGGVEARPVVVPGALGGHGGGFGDDQAGPGALGVVLSRERGGDAVLVGPGAGQGGHHDPVGQLERPELVGGEQGGDVFGQRGGHARSLS